MILTRINRLSLVFLSQYLYLIASKTQYIVQSRIEAMPILQICASAQQRNTWPQASYLRFCSNHDRRNREQHLCSRKVYGSEGVPKIYTYPYPFLSIAKHSVEQANLALYRYPSWLTLFLTNI